MTRMLAVARNTFKENIRDRVLYNLILFALVMILASVALGQLTMGHEHKVIVDLGLASISVFGTLIAIFIGISLVYKELDKRTVYALLAKPVRRSEFILGKYFGLLTTLAVNVIVMTAGLVLTLMYQGDLGPGAYVRLLPAVYLLFLSLAVTTALALVFSTFSTPALSAVFTFFFWLIGHFNADLLQIGRMTKSAVLRWLTGGLYYVLPNMSNFVSPDGGSVMQNAAHFRPIAPGLVAWATLYAAVYCGILLTLAVAVFSRRDFK